MDTADNSTSLEPVGFQGQPSATLEAFRAATKNLDLQHAEVIVITDWQDRRATARYAVLVHAQSKAVLSEDAFGPRYGVTGRTALRDLINGMHERGVVSFKERIIAPHEFSRMMEASPNGLVRSVNAGANPVDPRVYTDIS